jgi:hypothetical protein
VEVDDANHGDYLDGSGERDSCGRGVGVVVLFCAVLMATTCVVLIAQGLLRHRRDETGAALVAPSASAILRAPPKPATRPDVSRSEKKPRPAPKAAGPTSRRAEIRAGESLLNTDSPDGSGSSG